MPKIRPSVKAEFKSPVPVPFDNAELKFLHLALHKVLPELSGENGLLLQDAINLLESKDLSQQEV